MIIAHLAYDTHSLLACCLTCSSWYIAAAPYLHHTLITPTFRCGPKLWWPDSFQDMHELGLFPLVKRLQIQGTGYKRDRGTTFSPEQFDHHILHQFSSLTNIRELGINDLDIPGFMPEIRRYFNHFLPTVRSLSLVKPRGSCRQIIFFIGLFQHLEDLTLYGIFLESRGGSLDDAMLFPSSIPPLRGRLEVQYCKGVGVLEDMISLFGGIRFCHLHLMEADGVQLLLNACAKTLETLGFSPWGYGEGSERVSLKECGL